MVLGVLTGWLARREREAVACLIEENRLLRRQLEKHAQRELRDRTASGDVLAEGGLRAARLSGLARIAERHLTLGGADGIRTAMVDTRAIDSGPYSLIKLDGRGAPRCPAWLHDYGRIRLLSRGPGRDDPRLSCPADATAS
jgi:hypothetical protein